MLHFIFSIPTYIGFLVVLYVLCSILELAARKLAGMIIAWLFNEKKFYKK